VLFKFYSDLIYREKVPLKRVCAKYFSKLNYLAAIIYFTLMFTMWTAGLQLKLFCLALI